MVEILDGPPEWAGVVYETDEDMVADEIGMSHPAKVVLVGDDRQLAAIDAGGGFRALRLRLGASELTENRRQHQAWEREPSNSSGAGWWRRQWPPIASMTG